MRRKLNAMPAVFQDKNVLLVDDSIVRGTTMAQIVDMVRKAGAKKVFLAPSLSRCLGLLASQRESIPRGQRRPCPMIRTISVEDSLLQ